MTDEGALHSQLNCLDHTALNMLLEVEVMTNWSLVGASLWDVSVALWCVGTHSCIKGLNEEFTFHL